MLAGIGCYGAYEYAHKLEGTVSYLVISAPVVAATAALIPPIAEQLWYDRQWVKALLLWAVLVPCAATVFFASAERVHLAKAGAEAERLSRRNAVERAMKEYLEANKAAAEADNALGKWRGRTGDACPTRCQTLQAADMGARGNVEAAKMELLKAEANAPAESPMKAPAWLLPAALDLAAFMLIWAGLTGPRPRREQPAPKPPSEPDPMPVERTPVIAEQPFEEALVVAPKRKAAGPGRSKIKKTVSVDGMGAAPHKAARPNPAVH